jgi:hypothetical protein
MTTNEEPLDEERDSVAPQPEQRDPADAGGDSPGPEIGAPDEPTAVDRPGTTVEEQRTPSIERRLDLERPDVWETGRAGDVREPQHPILDDDVAVEDLGVERPAFDPEEADLDRTGQEASEESPDLEDEGPEGAAMHVEPE